MMPPADGVLDVRCSNPKILHGSITVILLELNDPGIVICVRYEILRFDSSIKLDCSLKIVVAGIKWGLPQFRCR